MREITPDTLEAEWALEGPERSRELANSFSPKRLTALEAKAVTLFKEGLRYQDKRYRVPLLWKDASRPRDNYPEARKLFLKQEERMRRTPNLEEKFQEAIATWLKSEWAELVPRGDTSGFFIPAFMVVRTDKATTKYRLILNGASEFGGKCINDFLLAGPSRMNKLWDVLVRSRRCLYVLACDIESMFLNIKVDEEGGDPRYLRLLFRDPRTGQERALQCLTHVFGLTQSPYVAMEVVRHHVFKNRAKYPYAEQAIREDIIMDDIIHSTNSKEKLMRTQAELVALFEEASMNIHKWATNLPELWAQLPENSREPEVTRWPQRRTSCSAGAQLKEACQ